MRKLEAAWAQLAELTVAGLPTSTVDDVLTMGTGLADSPAKSSDS